jgi:hypothetical protein
MDIQAPTIGSALPASEREEHFADTAPVSPRKTPEQRTRGRARQTCPSHRRGRIGIRGDADAELIGDATEEIKRLREQLIECDDEIRDLRYRMHLRGYNPTLW